jgi:hypothetical protein
MKITPAAIQRRLAEAMARAGYGFQDIAVACQVSRETAYVCVFGRLPQPSVFELHKEVESEATETAFTRMGSSKSLAQS